MLDVAWSRCGDQDCVRLRGLGPGVDVRVRPAGATDGLPPMAGRLVRDGDDTCFLPRFAFVAGTTYTIVADGVVAAVLERPRNNALATTEVLGIYPTATEVPRNLLRFYIAFSAPMSEGQAASNVGLRDESGERMPGALLPTEHELWDTDRCRLTVLLDPARIKRGLVAHREHGYPLRSGASFRFVVDTGFRDARGAPLRVAAARGYRVGDDERHRVDPDRWTVTAPAARSVEPLHVLFDRPLDHALLARCLKVVDPAGRTVDGTPIISAGERSWQLVPRHPWAPAGHRLVVDPVLEDVAGNSVSRVFDRDLTHAEDTPRDRGPVTVTFQPG